MEFRRVDIIISQPGAPPEGMARVLVYWELVTQHSGVDETVFSIERSLSHGFDSFENIAENIQGEAGSYVYKFVDVTPNLISFWRKYFYRIKAVRAGDTKYSKVVTWETSPRPHELAIIERHDFILRHMQGTPSFAFIERTADSARCTCYDPTAGRTMDSNCTLCLGTGFQQPYFDPILFYVDYNPDQKLVQISSFSEMQPNEKDCWFSAFPQLKPGDLIYEVMPGLLWRIARMNLIQPMGSTIQQIARLVAVERGDVTYRRLVQRIPDDNLAQIVQEWERNKEQRMF
jgi:hypothetical protein